MRLSSTLAIAMFALAPMSAFADPATDANLVVDRFSAAYTANDPDAVVSIYAPNAILLGTVSPIMSEGTDAIRQYFSMIKGSGNKNAIGERRTIVINDNTVLVTGFYEFTRMKDGQPTPAPARFTMLIARTDGEWRILHHHSSPLVQPK